MLNDDETKLRGSERQYRDLRDGASVPSEIEPITRNDDQAVGDQAIARPASPAGNPRSSTDQSEEPIGKWLKFWQGVLHVETSKMDLGIGVRNALGVALPLAVGIAIKMPLGGLAVASGALNVSYSDSSDPYKQRARRMLASSALCAIAVMAGGLAGHHNVEAVTLITVWAFGSGMAITLGATGESLGVIS